MPDTVRLRGFSALTDGISVEFLQPVPTDVKCVTCGDIVGILWRSKCHHNFCTQCLENLLGQGNKSICPVDSEDIRRNELTRDASVQEVAAALQVHCLNKGTGCEEVLQVGTLNEHLQNCAAQSDAPTRPPRRIDQSVPSTSMQHEQGPQAQLEGHENNWELHRQLIVTRMSEYRRNMEDVLAERDLLRNQLNEAHGTIKELKNSFEQHTLECSARNDTLLQQLRDMSFRITMVEREASSSRQQLQDLGSRTEGDFSASMNAAANLLGRAMSQWLETVMPITWPCMRAAVKQLSENLKNEAVVRNGSEPSAPADPFGSMLSGFTVNNHSVVVTGHADDVVCPDGIFLWRLSEYGKARRRERHGPKKYTSSPAFYAGNPGYHLKLRLFLNGIGQSRRGKFVAVNLVLMQGQHDAQLPWPFRQKVTVMLLDQTGDQHIAFTINDPGFPRPLTEYTIPYVWQEFVATDDLEKNGKFLRGDSLVFKVIVEPPGGLYPNLPS